MALQDRLAQASLGLKRKMYDFAVEQNGTAMPVIRVKVERDMYGQGRTQVIDNGTQTIYLDMPSELPMSRMRKSILDPVAESQSVFFYDVLPVDGYAKFENNVEKDDYLIGVFEMESDYWYFIFQVTEILGNLVQRKVTWKKFQCAPYSGKLPSEVAPIVDLHLDELLGVGNA